MVENVSNTGIANRPMPASAGESTHDKPEEHHWFTTILILLVIAMGVAALVLFRPKKAKTPPPPPVPVTVTRVQKGDIAVAVDSLGSVTPVYTASMSPRVDGQLIAVNYTEGQLVASNDLLAVIDPGPYQAVLTQAVGQLQRDTNLLAGANVDLQRYQAAYAKNAIAKQQVDDQVALVHQDEGVVKLDEGQVAAARVNVDYCYIRAPFAGRVGLRLIDPGNVVHAANTNAIVVVAQLRPITVIFNVAEDYLPQIEQQLKSGHDMVVEAWDRANEIKIATGKVLALNNLIDTSTGTIRIRAVFDNNDLTLFPNQFVNARLIIKILHDQDLVPTYAIQHNPEGAFAYVLTNATATNNGVVTNYPAVTMHTIVPGVSDSTNTAVKGLGPDDAIALDNFNKLGEGARVIPQRAGGGAPGAQGKNHGAGHNSHSEESEERP